MDTTAIIIFYMFCSVALGVSAMFIAQGKGRSGPAAGFSTGALTLLFFIPGIICFIIWAVMPVKQIFCPNRRCGQRQVYTNTHCRACGQPLPQPRPRQSFNQWWRANWRG